MKLRPEVWPRASGYPAGEHAMLPAGRYLRGSALQPPRARAGGHRPVASERERQLPDSDVTQRVDPTIVTEPHGLALGRRHARQDRK